MGLKPSRVLDSMDKINKLHSHYTDASEEISKLKSRKKDIKSKLKEARSEYEAIKGMELKKGEKTLMKADKKTAIEGLERLLEKTSREVYKLEKRMDNAFEKREKVKARVLRRMSFDERSPEVVVKKVGDVAAVAKMVDLMRVVPEPRCKIGDGLKDEAVGEAIKEAAVKLKVKIVGDEDLRPEILEKKIINKGKTRIGRVN